MCWSAILRNISFFPKSRPEIVFFFSFFFFFFFFLSSTTLCEFWLAQLFLSMVSFPVPSVSNYLLPSSSNHLSRHHPILYMFSLLFLNTRVGRLLTIRPSFHNWAFLAVLEFFRGEGAGLAPNPQPGGPGCLSSSVFYPLTCPAWVSLPVATLPPA